MIGAQLVSMPPPGIIFAPRGRPAVLMRLHTADQIRLASPVQEAQRAPTPDDRIRIMGFAIGNEHDTFSLLFKNCGGRIFSPMLWLHDFSLLFRRRSIYSSLYKVESGVDEHEKPSMRLTSLQAMSPATTRSDTAPPPDFMRYKV